MSWTPFEEIIEGNIVEALYAADLWAVYTGTARERYRDPDKFFQRTYFTSSLKNLLNSIARRLCGDPNANPVTLILTGLGGGKTHSLIAAYHLASSSTALAEQTLKKLREAGIEPCLTSAIAVVFDGAQADIKLMENEETPNLWTYLFHQLHKETGNSSLRKAVEMYKNTVPGAEAIRQLLAPLEERGEPVVILIDETLNYLKRLDKKGQEDTAIFIQHLTKAITQLKRSALVITFIDTEEGRAIAQDFVRLVERVSRNETMITHQELPAVIRASLISHIEGARKKAEQLEEKYRANPNYFYQYPAETLAEYYPIHPETVKVLSRLAELGVIQATRDVLRILAWTLHEVYKAGRAGDFITPADIPIDRSDVRAMIFKEQSLRTAVEQDLADVAIIEKAGGDCAQIARRIYRAIAIVTVSLGPVDVKTVVTHVYTPDLRISPMLIPTCLDNMIGQITHLHTFTKDEKAFYVVKSKKYWKALLRKRVEEATSSGLEKYERMLKSELEKLAKKFQSTRSTQFKVYVWESPPDEPQLALVLTRSREEAERIIDEVEIGGGRQKRKMRSSVFALIPDEGRLTAVLRRIAEREVAREIRDRWDTYGLDEDDVKQLEDHIKKLQDELGNTIARDLYTILCYAGDINYIYEIISLDLSRPEDTDKRLIEMLKQRGKLAEKISPSLVEKLVVNHYKSFNEYPTFKTLLEYLSGRLTDYPILLDARKGLKEALSSGNFYVLRDKPIPAKDVKAIDDSDKIATKEILPPSQPLDTPIIEVPPPPPPPPEQPPSFSGTLTPKELVNRLKGINSPDAVVEILLEGKAESREVEKTSEFLSFISKKMKNYITLTKAVLALTSGNQDVARIVVEVDRGDLAEEISTTIREILSRLSGKGSVTLQYTLKVVGKVEELVRELDTRLLLERFGNYTSRVRVEVSRS